MNFFQLVNWLACHLITREGYNLEKKMHILYRDSKLCYANVSILFTGNTPDPLKFSSQFVGWVITLTVWQDKFLYLSWLLKQRLMHRGTIWKIAKKSAVLLLSIILIVITNIVNADTSLSAILKILMGVSLVLGYIGLFSNALLLVF